MINLVAVGDAFWLMMAGMWERGEKDTLQLVFLSFLMIIISGLVLLTALHSYLMIANLTTCKKIKLFRVGDQVVEDLLLVGKV